jgi:hypothetical protein
METIRRKCQRLKLNGNMSLINNKASSGIIAIVNHSEHVISSMLLKLKPCVTDHPCTQSFLANDLHTSSSQPSTTTVTIAYLLTHNGRRTNAIVWSSDYPKSSDAIQAFEAGQIDNKWSSQAHTYPIGSHSVGRRNQAASVTQFPSKRVISICLTIHNVDIITSCVRLTAKLRSI